METTGKNKYNHVSTKIPKDAYVIIIGAMRCGTTSLFQYLSQHPEICPSKVKEPEFFSKKQIHKLKTINYYEELWDFDSLKHKYALEASTGYTKYPFEKGVAERMATYGISPMLIYILRNPFERIISHHNFAKSRLAQTRVKSTDELRISISNYYKQLEPFSKYFPKDRILLLDYDELKNNQKDLLAKVYKFLSITPYFPESFTVVNESKSYTELDLRIRKLRLGRFVPSLIKYPVRRMKKYVTPLFFGDLTKTELTDDEKQVIYKSLHQDMQKLKEEYGVDVTKWGF